MKPSFLLFSLLILLTIPVSSETAFSSIYNLPGISINENLLAQNNSAEDYEEDFGDEPGKDTKKKKKEKKEDVSLNGDFFFSLIINLLTVILLLRFIYYPNYKNRDSLFTFFLFNIIVFMLTYLLNQVKISMGAAFGLFAVFSMLRYRTEGISTKDMTYLFIVIAVGLLSAIKLDFYELLLVNLIIVIVTYALDGNVLFKREYSKVVQYENIELIKPDRQVELIADLSQRTGIKIQRISIIKIDFLRDIASIRIYYFE